MLRIESIKNFTTIIIKIVFSSFLLTLSQATYLPAAGVML